MCISFKRFIGIIVLKLSKVHVTTITYIFTYQLRFTFNRQRSEILIDCRQSK